MFPRLHSKKSDHPLADPAAAGALLGEITKRECLPCLQGLTELLDKVKTATGLELARAFDVIDQLDRVGRPYWRKAAHEYYEGSGKLTNYQASRVWVTVGEYIVQLAEAYEFCLAVFQTDAPALRSQLPRIIGRALRLRASAQSWDYARYVTQFGSWAELYRLYQLAEMRGCATEKVVLYRGGRFSTIEREFMQALMLSVAAPHSMLPEQINVADRVTARLAHSFALSSGGQGSRPYFFDPASANPPARELPGIRPPFTARRFGPGDAEVELRKLAARADSGELLLSEIGVERHSEEIVAPTLHHLTRYWCEVPPERRHSRQRDPLRISVVNGLDDVVAKVGNLLVAYPFSSAQETWLIENRAEGGIGALVANPYGTWARVGCLVAYRYPDGGVWNLGVVRHISEEDVDRFLGIELVSSGGVAVSLHEANDQRRVTEDCFGVWLAGGAPKENQIRLLTPLGTYSPLAALHMRVHDRKYLLTPVQLIASGVDYQIGLYSAAAANSAD